MIDGKDIFIEDIFVGQSVRFKVDMDTGIITDVKGEGRRVQIYIKWTTEEHIQTYPIGSFHKFEFNIEEEKEEGEQIIF